LGEVPRKIIRKVPEGHGLEAWRRLSRRCCPESGSTQSGQMNRLLNFIFGDGSFEQYQQCLLEFEAERERYDRHHELEEIGSEVCESIVIAGAPEPLQTQLQLMSGQVTYAELLERIEDLLAAKGVWASEKVSSALGQKQATSSETVPMQIDALSASKSKGKDKKGKGKGKKKGKTVVGGLGSQVSSSATATKSGENSDAAPWNLQCFRCGGWGHRADVCPSPSFAQDSLYTLQENWVVDEGESQNEGEPRQENWTEGTRENLARRTGQRPGAPMN